MRALARWLYLVSLALWLGSIVFFSFAVAPALFRSLPRAEAGLVVSSIFPVYYGVGYACGAVLVVTALFLSHTARPRAVRWRIAAVLAAVMLGATLYAGRALQPRIQALRTVLHNAEGAPAVKEEFDRLHRMAVGLNSAVLFGAMVISVLTAGGLREK